MQRPTAIKAFETEGIQVFADTARTEFRNVIEIFDEMASKWPTMGEDSMNMFVQQAEQAGLYSEEMAEVVGLEQQYSDIQQRDLSQAAAGIYRRNYLLALLQNWSKVDEVLISQENSLGYSMKENERTMQTMAKQIEVMKASAEQLSVALGDSGLLNELTALIEGTTDAIQWFNELDDSTQTLILTLTEVTLVVKLLSIAMKGLGVSGAIAGVGGLLGGWAVPITATTKSARVLASTLGVLPTILKNVSKGLMAAVGGPYAVAAITIGTAIGFIARESNKASEELASQATMAEGLVGEYDSLTTKLGGMTKGTDEYNKTSKELSVLNSNIADVLPEVIDGWDTETDSIKINREAMEKVIEAGKDLKQSKEEQAESIDKARKAYQEETQAHEKKAQEWNSDKDVLSDLTDRREELTKALSKQTKGSEKAIEIQEALGETETLIAGIAQKAGLDRNATVDKIIEKLGELQLAESNLAINTAKLEREKVFTVKQNSLRRLAIIQEELKAYDNPMSWGFTQAAGNFLKAINPMNANNYDPANPETAKYLNYDNLVAQKAEEANAASKAKAEIEAMDADITASINAINAIQADALTGGPGPGGGGNTGSGSSSDWLTAFLANALAAAEAQARLNDATQRGMDILDAKGSLYVDNAMSVQEYVKGLKEQNSAEALLEKHQSGLHAEAEAYRTAISALEAKQKTLNTSTEEGQEAYSKIADEIENAKQKIDELGQSWLGDEAAQRAIPTEKFQEMSQWVDKLVSMGAINLEQQMAIYEAVDKTKLIYSEQVNLMEKQVDLGKQLLEQEVDKKIAAIEKEKADFKAASDARITSIQAEIDALDEENDALQEQQQVQTALDSMTKARKELADAQAKLSNVQGEKNTRIWQNGRFEYAADPKAVKDAQKEVESAQQALLDAQQSFNDTMASITQKAQQKELEAQIQHEKDLQDEKDKAADEAKKKLQDDWDAYINGTIPEKGAETNTALAKVLDDLNLTAESKLAIMAGKVSSYVAQMKADLLSISEVTGVDITGIVGPNLVGSFDSGGPIPQTGLAVVHKNEYMLTAEDVATLGGFGGVRRMVAAIKLPQRQSTNTERPASNPPVTNSPTHIDKRVIIQQASFPQVVDGSGLIRNLRQMAQS